MCAGFIFFVKGVNKKNAPLANKHIPFGPFSSASFEVLKIARKMVLKGGKLVWEGGHFFTPCKNTILDKFLSFLLK